VRAETSTPFDAHREDAGELSESTPAAMLGALARIDPGLGLLPFANAADAVARLAGHLRRAHQQLQFRLSETAARLYGITALAESCIIAHASARPILDAALALTLAREAGPIACGVAEVAAGVGVDDPFVASALLHVAASAHVAEARAFGATEALFARR
jgi:hypothetical protein